MAFTRTVNYVQNEPANLGFGSAYFTPTPSRNITCSITLNTANAATIDVPAATGLTIQSGLAGLNSAGGVSTILSGDVAVVNAALNAATFNGIFYDIEDSVQNFLTKDRYIGNSRGELLVQLPVGTDLTNLAVDSVVFFSTVGSNELTVPYRYRITKLDTTNSAVRVWVMLARTYNLEELYYNNAYKNVKTSTATAPCMIQYGDGVNRINIAPVIDVAYMNPNGSYALGFTDNDSTGGGTITMIGEPQIPDPYFLTTPPTSISAQPTETWNLLSQMGTIAQVDDNYQSVQLLIKCLENDPMYLDVASYTSLPGYPTSGTEDQKLQFIGDAIDAKAKYCVPRYITDKSYGVFGDTQVNDRASVSYPDTTTVVTLDGLSENQVVRWSYYDVPKGCNDSLGKIYYYRPAGFNKSFTLEVRIVNGTSRIYATRGK